MNTINYTVPVMLPCLQYNSRLFGGTPMPVLHIAQSLLYGITVRATLISLKVGFHYPSSRPEYTGRVDGP